MDIPSQIKIARTGFFISLTSYGLFWLMDALRPGFVSRSFSVHLFLLCTIVFGVWWAIIVENYQERAWVQRLVAVILGFFLAVLTLRLGEGLGILRILLVIFAACLPSLFLKLLKE